MNGAGFKTSSCSPRAAAPRLTAAGSRGSTSGSFSSASNLELPEWAEPRRMLGGRRRLARPQRCRDLLQTQAGFQRDEPKSQNQLWTQTDRFLKCSDLTTKKECYLCLKRTERRLSTGERIEFSIPRHWSIQDPLWLENPARLSGSGYYVITKCNIYISHAARTGVPPKNITFNQTSEPTYPSLKTLAGPTVGGNLKVRSSCISYYSAPLVPQSTGPTQGHIQGTGVFQMARG